MITSSQNELLKQIRFLKDKKYRDETGLFTVEGIKAVKDAFICGIPIKVCLATEKGAVELEKSGVCGVEIKTVSESAFAGVSAEKSPQGVIAVCVKPVNPYKAPDGRCLYLDNIQDPANTGAILRTAAACGITEVYLAGGADPFSPKAVRTAMGGVFRVNCYKAESSEFFKDIKVPVIATDMNGENVFDFDPPEKFCLVIGNEGQGIEKAVKEKADYTVSIPMKNGVESLNAGVSAGIIMYLFSRK